MDVTHPLVIQDDKVIVDIVSSILALILKMKRSNMIHSSTAAPALTLMMSNIIGSFLNYNVKSHLRAKRSKP